MQKINFIKNMISCFKKIQTVEHILQKSTSKYLLPETKNCVLSIPSHAINKFDSSLSNLMEVIQSSNFRYQIPNIEPLSAIYLIVIVLVQLIVLPIYTISLIKNIFNEFDSSQLDTLIILASISSIVLYAFYIGLLTLLDMITIWFGKIKINYNQKYLYISYEFIKIHKIKIEIHYLLNPVIETHNDILSIVIRNNNHEIFYQHRIGKISIT